MKTNAMRILDFNKIEYKICEYMTRTTDSSILKEDKSRVFKTLVTVSKSKDNFIFVVPTNHELDLKKAAKYVKEKSIEMIKQKELLPLTGYIHGGCSPLGMKKTFRTVFHSSALEFKTIFFSGGKIGYQIEVNFKDIKDIFNFETTDLIME